MDEEMTKQLTETAARLAGATEALEKALERLEAQQEAIGEKVERIVAAIDERAAVLERAPAEAVVRKTLSPLVSALLSKNREEGARIDAEALDKALGALSLEQRIAVKAEMARAGMIE